MGRLTKLVFLMRKPLGLDIRLVRVQEGMVDIAVDKEGDGQHVAVDGLVANPLACYALFIWHKSMATKIRMGKLSEGRRGSAIPRGCWAVLPTLKALLLVGTTGTTTVHPMTAGTMVATLFKSVDARFIALNMTELEFVIVECVVCTVPTSHTTDPRISHIMHMRLCIVVDESGYVSEAEMLWKKILVIRMLIAVNV